MPAAVAIDTVEVICVSLSAVFRCVVSFATRGTYLVALSALRSKMAIVMVAFVTASRLWLKFPNSDSFSLQDHASFDGKICCACCSKVDS